MRDAAEKITHKKSKNRMFFVHGHDIAEGNCCGNDLVAHLHHAAQLSAGKLSR
jgi:hypothetical protein